MLKVCNTTTYTLYHVIYRWQTVEVCYNLPLICDVDSKVERVKAAFEKADKDSSLGRIDDTKRDKER